jgi:hypothetical protein
MVVSFPISKRFQGKTSIRERRLIKAPLPFLWTNGFKNQRTQSRGRGFRFGDIDQRTNFLIFGLDFILLTIPITKVLSGIYTL